MKLEAGRDKHEKLRNLAMKYTTSKLLILQHFSQIYFTLRKINKIKLRPFFISQNSFKTEKKNLFF